VIATALLSELGCRRKKMEVQRQEENEKKNYGAGETASTRTFLL
jgi:hypothetical protein